MYSLLTLIENSNKVSRIPCLWTSIEVTDMFAYRQVFFSVDEVSQCDEFDGKRALSFNIDDPKLSKSTAFLEASSYGFRGNVPGIAISMPPSRLLGSGGAKSAPFWYREMINFIFAIVFIVVCTSGLYIIAERVHGEIYTPFFALILTCELFSVDPKSEIDIFAGAFQ